MPRLLLVLAVVAALSGTVDASVAHADPGPAPTDSQHRDGSNGNSSDSGKKKDDKGRCPVNLPGPVGAACDAISGAAQGTVDTVTGAPGKVAGAVAGSVLDQATGWMTDAATWVTKEIAKGIQATTTPELDADWYRQRFASMVTLGLGLAALVAMLALASAAIRRDPEALGLTLYGMVRAGVATGLVLVLTVLALGAADSITNAVAGDAVGKNAGAFWDRVASAWGRDNFAGFGSSAIAFLFALLQVVAAIAVWVELLMRQAAIYVAVLFMPAALAASIWPPLREWESRLTRALFVLIAMKPVVVTVLALAGSAAAAAMTGQAQHDIGVLLAAIVIFALAAFAPWGLMALVSMSAEGGWAARGVSSGAREGVASGGSRVGGALGGAQRVAGRLRGGGGAGGFEGGGGGGASGPSGGKSGGGGGGASGGAGASGAGGAASGGALSAGGMSAAGAVGGAVAAAAGMGVEATRAAGARAGETAQAASDGGRGSSSGGSGGGSAQTGGGAARGQRTGRAGDGNRGRPRGGGGGGDGGSSRPVAPSPRTGQQPGGPGGASSGPGAGGTAS